MKIAVNNLTKRATPPLECWLGDFLFFACQLGIIKFFQGELSVAIIGEKRMAKLNEAYRKKKGSTDVLSFLYEKKKNYLEGELVFCPKVIERRGGQNGLKIKEEWRRDFVHGMLHLLGWEHGEKMFFYQEKILELMKKK